MNPSKKSYWLVYFFILLVLAFVIYSFAFVDLNLTLSSFGPYQVIQRVLTQLGYYNRPLSTAIYFILILSSFFIYVRLISNTASLSKKIVAIFVGISCILVFAYPALSHDFFNYMFDARVVTEYGLSPYFFKALDFPDDTWTRFMRWTHRYYPYGPVWLGLTLIPSWIGMSKFVLTLWLYKLLFLGAYVGNSILLYKLARQKAHLQSEEVVLFFALNPLILIESLISPHNESIMLFFTLLALYWFAKNKLFAYGVLLLSVGIKFVSILFLPLFFVKQSLLQNYTYLYILWFIGLLPVIVQREAYPWYFVPMVAFAALSQNRIIKLLTIAGSFALLFRYVPYIKTGTFLPHLQNLYMVGGFLILLCLLTYGFRKKSF